MSTDSGIQTATDDGEFLFPFASPIFMVAFWIDTDTVEIDYLSTAPPPRVMHAGWIAAASGLTGQAGNTLTFDQLQIMNWWFFDHAANQRVINDGFAFYDRIIYHIPSGVIAKFVVFYTFP